MAQHVRDTKPPARAPRAATTLRFQRALLQAQSEASLDGILVVGLDGRILSFNQRFATMWALPEIVLATRSNAAALRAVEAQLVDPQAFLARIAYLFAHPHETSHETLHLKDGRVFDRYSAPVIEGDGTYLGRVWFFRDVTAQRQAEDARAALIGEQASREAAVQRSERLRALHDAALTLAVPELGEPAAVAGLLTRIVAHATAALGGHDSTLLLAEDPAWADLLPGSDSQQGAIWLDYLGRLGRRRPRPQGATAHVLRTGEPVVVADTREPSAFGSYDALATRGIGAFAIEPLRAGGRVLGTLSMNFGQPGAPGPEEEELLALFAAHAAAALDRVRLAAAERQVARQARQLARREAEAAALRELHRLKDEFLATIAHELRTPLTVLSGYAQWLQQRAAARGDPMVGQSAAHMVTAAAELTRLVEDLLDFARLQRGSLRVQAEPVDLAPVLRQVVAGLREPAGVERLVVDLPARVPAYADPVRVAQAAGNLLENALRYAPMGPIVFRVAAAPADRGMVRVEVADQGPGIPDGEQARIWEKFYRGHGVAGLNVARGSGIGLAVVKALVEAQGGHVGLESSSGRGATFWFELPSRAPSARPRAIRRALSAGPV